MLQCLVIISLEQDDMEAALRAIDPIDAQRPFKTFLALLDRWEIGNELSVRLAISSLGVLRNRIMRDRGNGCNADVSSDRGGSC